MHAAKFVFCSKSKILFWKFLFKNFCCNFPSYFWTPVAAVNVVVVVDVVVVVNDFAAAATRTRLWRFANFQNNKFAAIFFETWTFLRSYLNCLNPPSGSLKRPCKLHLLDNLLKGHFTSSSLQPLFSTYSVNSRTTKNFQIPLKIDRQHFRSKLQRSEK